MPEAVPPGTRSVSAVRTLIDIGFGSLWVVLAGAYSAPLWISRLAGVDIWVTGDAANGVWLALLSLVATRLWLRHRA